MKIASSNNLFALKEPLENTMLFLVFQMDQVRAIHQHCHLLLLTPSTWSPICWLKFIFGVRGAAPFRFIHDIASHHKGWIFVQWKNRCPAFSSSTLRKGHEVSATCTCLRCNLCLVGSLSLISLQAKIAILLGTFILHNLAIDIKAGCQYLGKDSLWRVPINKEDEWNEMNEDVGSQRRCYDRDIRIIG